MLAKMILAGGPAVKSRNKNISLEVLDMPRSCLQKDAHKWKCEATVLHRWENLQVITSEYEEAQTHLLDCDLNNSKGFMTGISQLHSHTFLTSSGYCEPSKNPSLSK